MLPVKLWCSCIRDAALRDRMLGEGELLARNDSPREGDVVLVRALSDNGAYDKVEEVGGREVRVYTDDVFAGVLGTRKSGTNLTAVLPPGPVCRGDVLELAAVGGLIGKVTFTPRYYGGSALPVEVVGFFPDDDGWPVNLREFQRVPQLPASPVSPRVVFVCASSAEAGKTTFVCEAIRALRHARPEVCVAAIKACGTGRLRDLLRYADAGADSFTDFVAAGWPSTYNISDDEYQGVLESLIVAESSRKADLVLVEIGGDLLEACAPVALQAAARREAPVVFCVNDALGAIAGLTILNDQGITAVTVATMNQNQLALADRLGLPFVLDPLHRPQVEQVVLELLSTEPIGLATAPA